MYGRYRTILIRRQDITVLLLYCLGYSRIKNLILSFQRIPVTRFVTFHDLMPETLRYFERNLLFLKRKTNLVSIDDFFLDRLALKKTNVVVTFDDGYKSWVTHALPILKKYEIPATFFVSSGFVGLSGKTEAKFISSKLFRKLGPRQITGCLSSDNLKRLADEGFTIGGHTLNHCNLAELRDRGEVQYEIFEDKKRLETMTGGKVKYFSYPGGDYFNPSINITGVLKDAGYIGAVTTVPGFNSTRMNPYLLHRELTHASMPVQVFRARVYGNYDAVISLKQKIRILLHRK